MYTVYVSAYRIPHDTLGVGAKTEVTQKKTTKHLKSVDEAILGQQAPKVNSMVVSVVVVVVVL